LISALDGPVRFPRSLVVLRRAVPLDVCIGLQKPPKAALPQCLRKEEDRIVETMLADNTELDSGGARSVDHLPYSPKPDGHRLLYQHVLAR
jgi:hypothetical protein